MTHGGVPVPYVLLFYLLIDLTPEPVSHPAIVLVSRRSQFGKILTILVGFFTRF